MGDTQLSVGSAHERIESAMFLAAIVVVLVISKAFDHWAISHSSSIDIYSNTFVWIYTVAVCAPVLAYLIWQKRPLSEFGVTLHNGKQSLIEGIVISAILILLGALVLTVIGKSEGRALSDYIKSDWLKVETLAYIPHSIIQEFVFRGIVLSTLVNMFRGHSLFMPLLISNLVYAFMHLHLGWGAVTLTFVIGYLFSAMYLRHRTILGVSVAHLLLGSPAFLFGVI